MKVSRSVVGLVAASVWAACGIAACAAGAARSGQGGSGAGGGMGGSGMGGMGGVGGMGGGAGGLFIPDSGSDSPTGCPSTCQQLGASCGTVTDTKCGGVVQCGGCPAGTTCGGGGVHNQCGTGNNPDACVPQTCAMQNVSCGQTGDGCNHTLQCGTCNAPQTCGGDPTKPGQCGCTGTCAMVPTCEGGTTTLSGTVWDPAGVHQLYNALVYIPNDPSDPGLQPFPPGISCDVCGATAAGNPLVTAYTAPDGTFTLTGVPVGPTIPLVIQLGRWRRQFKIDIATACGANTVPAKMLTMPQNHTQGDIPRIGILTGSLDPVECELRKMGVQDSEFTDPGAGGYINFYLADQSGSPFPTAVGAGVAASANTPQQAALFATNGGTPVINQYDIVIVECEGYPQAENAAQLTALRTYAESGGRLFTSDFAETWLETNGNFAQTAKWVAENYEGAQTADIDVTSNPKGMAFESWLEVIGLSAKGSGTVSSQIQPTYRNTTGVVAPTQQWLYWKSGTTPYPMHFTFNTPVGAASAQQCGRVVFSDWHASSLSNHDKIFPGSCTSTPMTAQEAILEFMLFDLSACVQPYTPVCTPRTCAQANVMCGPASDGCGNLLQCGTCPSGQYCGGGGPGMCGTTSMCTPETCPSQGIECGPAGDGCGNTIDCGNCPTGEICGIAGVGKCGKTQ